MAGPILYTKDRSSAGRIAELERRVARLESGSLFRGKSVRLAGIYQLTGPWPQTGTFTIANPDSAVGIFWSGTMYVATADSVGSLWLTLDGSFVDINSLFFNNAAQHLGLPYRATWRQGLAAGAHTCGVSLNAGSSDSNDTAFVMALEFPQ